MLYAGLDLSRKRVDFHLLDGDGATLEVGAAPPDADGLDRLAERLARHGAPIRAAIESINGARFVHDRLELAGWQVEIAEHAQKVKGLAPLACKTDRIDAWVLAELARRDLVPAIWLPDPRVRAERERARWRLHLVRHRSSLKQRVHAVLLTHGKPCPVSDLFGVRGRQLLARLGLPEPWQATIKASLPLIDELDREIGDCERELRRLGADHRYVPLLCTVPGIGWVLAYTIAAELGDIGRFPSPRKLVGYSGLCPRVYQSGQRDPAFWPDDPVQWLSPKAMLGAWVAETDGRIVGHVALSAGAADTSASVWSEATGLPPEQFASIIRLFVSTDSRGVGVGHALLDAACAEAATRGLHPALDVVETDHDAIRLYEQSGWRRVRSEAWTADRKGKTLLHYYVAPLQIDQKRL
jgi:transposase